MNILRKLYTPNISDKTAKHTFAVFVVLIITFLLSTALAFMLGTVDFMTLPKLVSVFSEDITSPEFRILFYVRLPRILGCILSGSALAVSGVLIQAVLNNAMAAPNIIGVNSGAGFAVAIVVALFPYSFALVPFSAFFGALLSCMLIYFIAKIINFFFT